jgi:Ni/Fe-hydrogenase subunit HybB-like protein
MPEKNRNISLIGMLISLILMGYGGFSVYKVFTEGLAATSLQNTIVWGVLISNFVFWIGIGHAGTFISAILLLLNQNWRKPISRVAEAMTIVAIIIAALMPIIHLGIPQQFYKLFPFTSDVGYSLLNFNSPLQWDIYAIGVYFILSLGFFHIGLLPDFARKRDLQNRKHKWYFYNYFSLGWTGTYQNWQHLRIVSFFLAGLITPLVISVHSIVSLDFAVNMNPGWHSTLFPVYFVFGALLSGFAFINIILALVKKYSIQKQQIKNHHFENINKLILFTSTILIIIYLTEYLYVWLNNDPKETQNLLYKLVGSNLLIYAASVIFTLLIPQLLWKKKWRQKSQFAIITGVFDFGWDVA